MKVVLLSLLSTAFIRSSAELAADEAVCSSWGDRPEASGLALVQQLSRRLFAKQELLGLADGRGMVAAGRLGEEQDRGVPPFESWPEATSSADCRTAKGQRMLQKARWLVRVTGWQGFSADAQPLWEFFMGKLFCSKATQYVLQTGTWSPLDSIREYGLLSFPGYNGGALRWLRYQVNESTVKCDEERNLITYQVVADARTLVRGTYAFVPNDDSALQSLVFDESLSCVSAHYVRLPSVLDGVASASLAPEGLCSLAQKLCGARFPYTGLQDCVSFMRGLPGRCDPDTYVGNTTNCRTLHLLNAFHDPDTHCHHISRSSQDPRTGTVKCGEGDCRGPYVSASEADAIPSLENCYTRASDLAVCKSDPLSSECCGQLAAYTASGCFEDETVMSELPSAIRLLQLLEEPCTASALLPQD